MFSKLFYMTVCKVFLSLYSLLSSYLSSRVVKAIAEKSSKKIKSDSVIHKEITESDSASDTYVKLVKDSEETVDSALQQGLKEGKTRKRKKEDTSKEGGTKKTKLW